MKHFPSVYYANPEFMGKNLSHTAAAAANANYNHIHNG
jgi:hypothetical protein